MKKTLLVAAVAAMSLGATAQTLTQNWKCTDVPVGSAWGGDVRQGVGVGEKIYLNNSATKTVDVYGANGKEKSIETGFGWSITADDAGNIIARAGSPVGGAVLSTDSIQINIITPNETVIPVSLEGLDGFTSGRTDYWGHAYGDVAGGAGYLMVALNGATTPYVIAFNEGAVDPDNSFALPVDGDALDTFLTQATLGFSYVDEDGNQHATLMVRNTGKMGDITLTMEDGVLSDQGATNKNIALQRGNDAGGEIFKLGGKLYAIYDAKDPNGVLGYNDAFDICDLETGEVVASQPVTVASEVNKGAGNWTTVQIENEGTATISQFMVNGYVAQYTFSVPTSAVNDINVAAEKTYKTIENGQVVIVKGDAKYNVMGQAIK